jgi:hypothetical protein
MPVETVARIVECPAAFFSAAEFFFVAGRPVGTNPRLKNRLGCFRSRTPPGRERSREQQTASVYPAGAVLVAGITGDQGRC